uniref:Uncharacterized protein n=1 Tax=Panagrolaimus superbus TaxID=310955 RepID=A0A914YJ03_9BILA
MAETLVLRSLIDPKFSVEVDGRVIKSCSILQNVQDCTNNDGEVEVNMTQKQIEKFVHLHNHFPSADSPKDIEWTNNFFREMPENEFKDFCFKADFLDSQRFIEASGDYAVTLIDEFDIDAIQDYFNINMHLNILLLLTF